MDHGTDRRTKQLENSREWKKANPERHAELARAYRARNREKSQAQNRLNYAVRKGHMVRGACEVCGTTEQVHGHHHDYSKPYDVRWLCFKCHKDSHPVDDEDKAVKFAEAKKARMFGETNPHAKLGAEDVSQIRKLLEFGISQEKIGRAFGVSQAHISRIKLSQSRPTD
jgi:hypothetical protein